jgi:SAM-dependent methyltransferase
MAHDTGHCPQLEARILLNSGYHQSRLIADPKRDVVWRALWRYHFSSLINDDDCVLDLGCGYGNFINHVVARRRIALDSWVDFPAFLEPGVEAVVGDVTELDFLPDAGVDFAFASNLFEHIPQATFARVLHTLRQKLSTNGTLTILQPNYRYSFREYFDDYTHVAVWSHISLADFLTANDYEVLTVAPRFLPLTVKSRLPVSPWLIRVYLASPIKLLGKQMLITARPRR